MPHVCPQLCIQGREGEGEGWRGREREIERQTGRRGHNGCSGDKGEGETETIISIFRAWTGSWLLHCHWC